MKKLLLTLVFVSYLNVRAQNPIQEFNFNGTLNNNENTSSFIGTENFVSDRMGVAKGAQRLANKAMEAIMGNLPQNNTARSISIWVKFNDISTANYIWGYGSAYNAQYCGLLQQGTTSSTSDLSLASWGAANDAIVSTPLEKDTWYNYSITFDGAVSKIYRDGKLLKSVNGIKRDTKGAIFRLGEINTTVGINADIDDLKIYNIALTEEQVTALYTSSKAVINAGATQLVLEPAMTVKNGLTTAKSKAVVKMVSANTAAIARERNVVSKSVEVFSQGEKITSNVSSINDLPEGTYLLKITNGASKKITAN